LTNSSVARSQSTSPDKTIRIAIVGDVHGQWDERDESALISLGVDLALFVGDFGNEAVELVEQVAEMSIPIAVALGNHDAWYSATVWGRQKCPYDRRYEDRVQQQLEALGAAHIGYSQRDFPQMQFGIVGGRPFSWGGPDWKHADFYADRFDVHSMQDSCDRIVQAAQQSRCETLIFVSHNGPTGLGNRPEDPCGRDWIPIGGDYGDPDLDQAIATTKASGKRVCLVAFGHMHHALRHTRQQLRKRIHVGDDGTVYLNAACVPRVLEQGGTSYRNFSLVSLAAGQVVQIESVWASSEGAIAAQELLYTQLPCPSYALPAVNG
jgi:uncharacterized protein (TIGR04168 family)